MDLRATLAQRIFLPFYERRWGIHAGHLGRELDRRQYASPDAVAKRQFEDLQALIRFLHNANPFYRNRFQEVGFAPDDLRDWSDLSALPRLTKDDVRQHQDQLISEGFEKSELLHKRTGGSTGIPVHLYWDRHASMFKRALVRRHDGWAGYRIGRKLAALWGDTEKAYPLKERIYQALCERTVYFDTLLMDEAHFAKFVAELRRYRPPVLFGHAHSIYFFTEYLRDHGVDDVCFEAIISSAENLIDSEREIIEGHFGKVLYDRYGCEELSLVASECEAHDGLHVAAEGLIVEVVGGSDGSPGEVVVTDLVNRGMPFLRYDVGDLASVARGECACGRGLPRLAKVYGRTTDILYAPDGRKISGVSILDTFIIHVPGVRQGQIVQDAIDHIRLRIVPDDSFDESTRQHLARTVGEVFGSAMRHDLELIESVEPTARGKFQFTICQLDASDLARG